MTHIDSLMLRLSNERARLNVAQHAGEVALRSAWVTQLEREIDAELKFLVAQSDLPALTDDELLAELST